VQFRRLRSCILKTGIQKPMMNRSEPVPKCGEAVQCLYTYHHFFNGIPDMPESIMRHLWKLENFTSKASKQMASCFPIKNNILEQAF
jgi:hypothetical protein